MSPAPVRVYRLLDGKVEPLFGASRLATLATAILFARADTLGAYAAFCLLAGPLFIVASEVLTRRRLRTLVGLAEGQLHGTKAELIAAAREATLYPDRIAIVASVQAALFAVSFALVASWRGSAVDGYDALRIAVIGLVLAPLSGGLAHAEALLPRQRVLEALMSAGLTPDELNAAAPRRHQLRRRLILFIAISVFTSLTMTADLAAHLAQRGLEAIVANPGADGSAAQVAALGRKVMFELAILCGALLLFLVRAARRIGLGVGGPLKEIAEEAHKLSIGTVTARPAVAGDDEVGDIATSLYEIKRRLGDVIEEFKAAGLQISVTAEQISAVTRRHDEGAARQAASLNETNATTEELARSARQIAGSAEEVARIALRTLEQAEGAQSGASECAAAVATMQVENRQVADAVQTVDAKVQQIGKVVQIIHAIVDKSDLLALSAELEGTKAGAVGAGFTQVASEMRRLTDNVLQSTREIEQLIEEIAEATAGAVVATRAGVDATESASGMVNSVRNALEEIVRLASQTADAIRTISFATQQQESGSDQLAAAMLEILNLARASDVANQSVGTANVELSVLSRELKDTVQRLSLEKGERRG